MWKSKRLMICHTLAPLFSCILIVYIQLVANSYVKFEDKDPYVQQVPILPKCTPQPDCITLGFSIIDPVYVKLYDCDSKSLTCKDGRLTYNQYLKHNPDAIWINETLKYFANANNLTFNQDMQLLTIGSAETYLQYFHDNMNKTSYSIAF